MPIQVLLLGTIISEKTTKVFLNKGISPAPADIAQQYIVDGLNQLDLINQIHIISSPRIPSYPKVDIINVEDEEWNIGKAAYKTMGFSNIAGYGFVQREKRIVAETKKWAGMGEESKIILVYSAHSPFLKAAYEAKRINKNIQVGLIVPDLPQYMGRYGFIKKVLKRIDEYRITRLLKYVDNFLLYTKYMADYLKIPQEKWMLFEGLIDTAKIKIEQEPISNKEKVCVYAGNLDPRYAIDTLIAAFEQADVNAQLHIYGDPRAAERLRPLLDRCGKSKYIGLVSSDKMFEIMKNSYLLINPRPSTLELAKYSCPSKTFEYMATGTPVLMTRLPGVPEEYYDYLYIIDDETVSGFKNKLEEILQYDKNDLRNRGREAQLFLLKNKTAKVQMERVTRFMLFGDK